MKNPFSLLKRNCAKKQLVALALGGGGARGLAHLGVLKFIEDNGYHFDMITGTSAGAIFGALYLKYRDADQAYKAFRKVESETSTSHDLIKSAQNKSSFLSSLRKTLYLGKTIFYPSIINGEPLRDFLARLLGEDTSFSDLSGSFFSVATDLISGRDVVFHKGRLLTPVLASSSIPGVFPPVNYDNFLLIDGGTTQKLPSTIAFQLGAARVMGIDVSSPFKEEDCYENATEILIRSEEIASRNLHFQNRSATDLLLTPRLNKFHWYEFSRHEEAFHAGYMSALENREKIDSFFNARRSSPLSGHCCPEKSFFLS